MSDPITRIASKLILLASKRPKLAKVKAPLSSDELVEIEAQFGVKLPDEYRRFLRVIGSGGAGPEGGLFRLKKKKKSGLWRWKGDGAEMIGDLHAEFPHTAAWNLDGDLLREQEPDENERRFDSESFEDAYDSWRDDSKRLTTRTSGLQAPSVWHTRAARCGRGSSFQVRSEAICGAMPGPMMTVFTLSKGPPDLA